MDQAKSSDMVTRVGAIDLLRALTMVLMIFVNDLWSLKDIPYWLEHAGRGVDGMGLADIVFPAFLFIVGMSLPFAIDSRRAKGDNDLKLVWHVILRTIALLVMGVFLVNGESIDKAGTGIGYIQWNLLICVCFMLVWNIYPKSVPDWLQNILKAIGVVALIGLAVIYRGEGGMRFATHWWGILGLIGWSYLATALVTILAHGRLWIMLAGWLTFTAVSLLWAAGQMPEPLHHLPEPIGHGTMAALSMGGVVIGKLFQMYQPKNQNIKMTVLFLVIAAALVALGFYTRQFWGISKLSATPAWLFLCSAITITAFVALYWLSDVAGKASWFTLIKPAGTDTLLCYLMPYVVYALMSLLPQLPAILLTGAVGLVKSLLFALLCVVMAGCLSRCGVRLKL